MKIGFIEIDFNIYCFKCWLLHGCKCPTGKEGSFEVGCEYAKPKN